jgi:transcriptional regulator with GAF, ATPase, and Fis domain
MIKTRKMQQLEMEHGQDIDEIIVSAYRENKCLQYLAARQLGITRQTLSSWIKQMEIDLESIQTDEKRC